MQGKMSAKLRRLAEAEAAPKPAKIYTADELAEAARCLCSFWACKETLFATSQPVQAFCFSLLASSL